MPFAVSQLPAQTFVYKPSRPSPTCKLVNCIQVVISNGPGNGTELFQSWP